MKQLTTCPNIEQLASVGNPEFVLCSWMPSRRIHVTFAIARNASQLAAFLADVLPMATVRTYRQSERCSYTKVCYLAESLKCFGFKTDCVLYMRCNGEPCDETRFHDAMDRLIDKTRAKHQNLPVA